MRVAHGVVDQQVRDGVADRASRPAAFRPWNTTGSRPSLHVLREDAGQDRLARDAHVQRRHVALRVQAGRQLALRDRVVAALQHVLLARPDQLDRRAGHLLGDDHRLAHPVVHRAAPAEAAAEVDLVDLALRRPAGRRPRRSRPARPRRSASASRPRSARASSAPSRSSAPSSRGSGAGRRRPPRSLRGAAAIAARASPLLLPTTASGASSPSFSIAATAALLDLGVRALVPVDRQRVERGLGAPPGVGDHRHGAVADLHHLLHAGRAVRPRRRRSSSPCRRRPGSRGSRRSACRAASGPCRRPARRWSSPPCPAAAAACRRSSSPSGPSAARRPAASAWPAASATLP